MGTNPIDKGPVTTRVAGNLRALRESQHLSLAKLAEMTTEVGRPIGTGALHKSENGSRRLDVDDLVALAVALDVSPARLLLTDDLDDDVALTTSVTVPGAQAWRWFAGDDPLPVGPAAVHATATDSEDGRTDRFRAENRPQRDAAWIVGLTSAIQTALGQGLDAAAIHEYAEVVEQERREATKRHLLSQGTD